MENIKNLLENSPLNYNAFDFSKVDDQSFVPALKKAIELAEKRIDSIKNNSAPANFENTIIALECCSPELDQVQSIYHHLFGANTNEHLQKISQDFSAASTKFYNSISLDAQLFTRVKFVYEQPSAELTSEDKKLLENTYKSFVRNGALLSEDDKEIYRTISTELSSLSPQFSQNLLESTNSFSLNLTDAKDVEGMPDSLLGLSQQMAKDKKLEGWLFNLQYPSYVPFMKYCQNREYREKIYMAFGSRAFDGKYSNQDIVKKTVNLRLRKAQLLGFKNHAEFVLQERMAEKTDKVYDLFNELYSPSLDSCTKDINEIKKLAQDLDGITDFQPWDFSYYSEKLKLKKLNFDEEKLRPYFEVNSTVQGAFDIAAKLYQINFKLSDYPAWHPDVKVYEVFDNNTSDFIGLFYTDLFPRESKRSGAWANSIRGQGLADGKVDRPHTLIVCNFSPSTESTPSLLSLGEVTTLFHEFGHALHMLLTQCKYKSLSGANVYWDFVELPSQIMENWVTEKECLDMFAKHYKTGEGIPQEYIDAIIKSKQFLAGYASMRQLQFGALDMAWHTLEKEFDGSVPEFEKTMTKKYAPLPSIENTCASTAFGHLFAGGYSAGYYSYKWAEILDADAFEYFKENGIFNKEVAQKFKSEILEKGGTDHPMNLYKNFRGREPSTNALL